MKRNNGGQGKGECEPRQRDEQIRAEIAGEQPIDQGPRHRGGRGEIARRDDREPRTELPQDEHDRGHHDAHLAIPDVRNPG